MLTRILLFRGSRLKLIHLKTIECIKCGRSISSLRSSSTFKLPESYERVTTELSIQLFQEKLENMKSVPEQFMEIKKHSEYKYYLYACHFWIWMSCFITGFLIACRGDVEKAFSESFAKRYKITVTFRSDAGDTTREFLDVDIKGCRLVSALFISFIWCFILRHLIKGISVKMTSSIICSLIRMGRLKSPPNKFWDRNL